MIPQFKFIDNFTGIEQGILKGKVIILNFRSNLNLMFTYIFFLIINKFRHLLFIC